MLGNSQNKYKDYLLIFYKVMFLIVNKYVK